MSFRVFHPRFRDRTTGEMREASRPYVDFLDGNGVRRRLPAGRSKTDRDAEKFGQKLEQLVICCSHQEKPDADLDTWLRSLPRSTLAKFTEMGLIDAGRYTTAAVPLSRHIEEFERWLVETPIPGRGRKRTTHYVGRVIGNLRRLVDADECGFRFWADIDKAKVDRFLGRMSESRNHRTLNDYVEAIKCFCSWMLEMKRAVDSPVKDLKFVRVTKQIKRRGLEPEEAAKLIEVTAGQPERWGLTGEQRAVLYAAAIETGYRRGELASLKVKDFDLDENKPHVWRVPAVRLSGQFTKNREDAEQALRRARADQLKVYFAGREPEEPAFILPRDCHCTRMLRSDLKAADIAVVDAAGRVLTFHSLRHTLANLLDHTSVSLKARMDIMRHSTRSNLTLGCYTDDTSLIQKRDAVEKMPELPWPGEIQKQQVDEKVA